MSEDITMTGTIAYMSNSKSAVYFSSNPSLVAKQGTFKIEGTSLQIKKMQTALKVAYWGEDNRFPQNIENQLAYCGIAKSALNFKAKSMWGNGIMAGTITGYKDDGSEIFQPIKYDTKNPIIKIIESPLFKRAYVEFLLDFVTFGNCFPEMIFSKDGKLITGFVHQESCDVRFKQMDDDGNINTGYMSKLWGMAKGQFAHFDPKKAVLGLVENPLIIAFIDNKFVKQIDFLDMYNPLETAEKIIGKKGSSEYKSAILPVNYPSINKTYYQVPYWDGARLSGWFEIAAKVPSIYKTMYNNALNIKYHIEIPNIFFEERYGQNEWVKFTPDEKNNKKKEILKELDDYLSGSENAYKTLMTTYIVDKINGKEYGHIKITPLNNSTTIDKDLLASSAANMEILMAMQVHPAIFSAGMTGNAYRSGGGSGSDIREAFLVQSALLNQERNICLEPLNLIRDYNLNVGAQTEWENVVFRFRDTILTTLDTGAGTKKIVS